MDIFKRGDKVWFEYEKSGHSYERCGFILDGPFDNGFYRIKTANGAVDFYIHKDKIHYERPDKRIKELEEAYSKAEAMCDNSEPERVCRTCKNRECGLDYKPCVICKDHDMWESTNTNQYTGEYIYPVGAHIKYEDKKQIKCGTVIHHCKLYHESKEEWYYIREDGKSPSDKCDRILGCHILGYAAEWIDDPSIRKAFGLDIKNDIYENIKKQINKDQLNFHYGLSSIFPLAPNDAAEPLSYSTQRKLEEAYSKAEAMYGLKFNQTFLDDIVKYVNEDNMSINDIRKKIGMKPIKEDNKMKKEQKKRNRNIIKTEKGQRTIKDITFNGPAVIVKFEPTGEDLAWGRFKGDKVVVVCKDGDKYDMKTGFLLAILKEFLNNQSYGNILEKLDSFDALDIPQVGKDEVRK